MCRYNVNKEDLKVADKEYDCVMHCIVMIEIHLQRGNFDDALMLIKDIEKSLLVLKRLIEKNKNDTKINSLVNRFKEIGVDVTTITNAIKKS